VEIDQAVNICGRVHETLDIRPMGTTVEAFFKGMRVVAHIRSQVKCVYIVDFL
jgi:3-keto-L-gulonate-6-phosphate decarboxylase